MEHVWKRWALSKYRNKFSHTAPISHVMKRVSLRVQAGIDSSGGAAGNAINDMKLLLQARLGSEASFVLAAVKNDNYSPLVLSSL